MNSIDSGSGRRLAAAFTRAARRASVTALLLLPASAALGTTYQPANGRVVFGGGGATGAAPSSSAYAAASTFGAAAQLPPGTAGQSSFVLRSSPRTGAQYLAGYVNTAGVLSVLRYDGTTWTSEWSATVGGDGVNGRRFDIAFEKLTGRGLVVYSADAPGATLHYRVWDPVSGWSAEQIFTSALLSGAANAVKLAADASSGRIAAAVVDTRSALTVLVWDGASWGGEPPYALSSSPLYYASTPGDSDSFDLAFSSSSGDLTVAWGANPSSPALYTNRLQASGSWLASTYALPLQGWGVPTGGQQVSLAADPLSDRIGVVYAGATVFGPSLWAVVWDGVAWSSSVSVGYSSVGAPHTRAFAGLWLDSGAYPALVVPVADSAATSGKLSYSVVYVNATQTDWTSSTGTASIAWPWATGTAQKLWFQAQTDPGQPVNGMVAFADSKGSLWAKSVTAYGGSAGTPPSLTWANADGGVALTGALSSTSSQGFAFEYARPPLTLLGDNAGAEAASGALVCPDTSGTPYEVDRFTLVSTGANDRVTGVYFTVTSGNQAVGWFEITSDDGATVYQTGYSPYVPYQISPGNYYAQAVSIPVTSTPTQFRLKVIPANVSALPAGTNYTIAAHVTRIEASVNQTAGSDPGSGSVVVLRAAPPDPVWGAISALPGQGVLNWTDSGSTYASTVILRSASGSAITNGSLTDGTAYSPGTTLAGTPTDTVVYGGNGTSFVDSSGNAGGTYSYRAFAADACNNYSAGVTTAAPLVVPPVPDATTAGALSATVNSCSGVTLVAAFTGDGNGNNSATFTRNGAAFTCAVRTRNPPQNSTVGGNDGTWTCVDAVPPSPQSQTLTYGVTFADADGVSGSSPGVTVTEAPCVSSNGRIAFSTGASSATPASSQYGGQGTNNAFGPATQLPPGAAGQTFFVLRASPIRDEYLAGYVTSGGVLYVLRYDGAAWHQEWTANLGGDGVNGRRFDIAYEKVSGRAMVVYSGNVAQPSVSLRYRIWNAATGHWGTEQAFGTLQLFGTVNWVKLAARANSNQLAVAALDSTNTYLTALLWDGSAWGNEPSYALSPQPLSYFTTPGDLEVFDLAFTSLSGDLLLAWTGLDTNHYYYDLYTTRFQAGAGWPAQTAAGLGATTRYWQVILAPDPLTDQIGVLYESYNGSSTTLWARIWTGSGWIPYTTFNSTVYPRAYQVATMPAAVANQFPFTSFWLRMGGTSALVAAYSQAGTANKMSYAYLLNSAFTPLAYPNFSPMSFTRASATVNWPQTSTDSKVWFQGVTDLASLNRALVSFSDSKGALWAKRLVMTNGPTFTWSDAEGATSPLTSSLAQPPRARNFGFAYDHPPVTTFGDNAGLEAVTGSPACAASSGSSVLYDLDHFTLATSSNSWPNGTDTVTGVTVQVTAGNGAVGSLHVTSDTGVVLGSLAAQPSGLYAIPVTIPVTSTPAQYRIQVRPAPPAALPAGALYSIAANVVGITAGNPVGGSDPSSGSVIVDRVPPAPPVWTGSTASPGQVSLAWTNPGADFADTVILRSASGQPLASSSLVDGSGYAPGQVLGGDTVAYSGSGTSATDLGGAGTYLYRAFAADACNNYSAGVTTAAPVSVPPIPGATTGVALSASPGSCTEVTLVASFAGDGNGDDGVSFTRDGSPVSCASLTRSASGNSGTWTCTDSVPSADATYAYSAAFTDPDGVSGPTPLTAAVVQHACPASGGTVALGPHPQGPSPSLSASPGQTDVVAGRFSLTASASAGGAVSLGGIVLHNGGTASSADLASLQLYADVGAVAGSWDPGDQLVGSASWSPSTGAWIASGFPVPAGTTSYLATLSPAYGATPGRTFALSFSSADLSGAPGVSVVGTQAIAGGTVTIASSPVGQPPGDPTAGSLKPMVLILSPGNGTTASLDAGTPSKGVRVQVQVYDPSRTTVGSVKLSHDGGATFPDSLSLNPNYDAVVNQGSQGFAHVYQADLTTIPPGSWTLQATAVTAGGGAGYSASIAVTVAAKGSGDGNLLARNDSSELCIDCHSLQTHSSQSVSSASGVSKYGSWATTCRDCHTPHRTRNAQLMRESMVPPAYAGYQTARPVRFWDRRTGDSGTADALSFVSSSAPSATGLLGPCQACHTRTGGAIPRWRNTGNSDSHFVGAATQACTTCHTHANGFAGQESLGGQSCGTCHSSKFWSMQVQGTPAPAMPRLTRHSLGSAVQGTNDSPQNPGLTWSAPLAANSPPSRSCVGMCHSDHVHNDPAAWPAASHAGNFYVDGTTQASRALARDQNVLDSATYGFATSASTGALVLAGDYVPGQSGQGCLACHTNPVDASRPAVSGASFDASAHNVAVTPSGVPWEYVQHDGSRFSRNCTKCHAGSQPEGQAVSYRGAVQGVHYSDNPSLLAGAVRPSGNPASSLCYNCHGNGAVGSNNSNKAIASEFAKSGSSHPANADAVHDTGLEAGLAWGNALGTNSAAARHANCLDCHAPHVAQRSLGDARVIGGANGAVAGPAIAGATGAKLVPWLAAWTAPGPANFAVVASIRPGLDDESALCFKCHSSFYWGTDAAKVPTSPSGGFPETDVAMEFNPANVSFHPVLAPAPNPTPNILKPWSLTSRMRCTDCHASEATTDPDGPHGSAAKYLLKGPNTDWSQAITMSNRGSYRIFCANCHDVKNFRGTLSLAHTYGAGAHMNVRCFTCHAAVPHGGPRPGLVVAEAGVASGLPPQTAYDTAAPYFQGGYIPQYWDNGSTTGLYIMSYPAAGQQWAETNCSCNQPNWH